MKKYIKTQKSKRWTIVALSLILGVVVLWNHGADNKRVKNASHIVLSADDLAVTKQEDFMVKVPISGELYPLDQTTVIAKVTAEAQSVYVREGQKVKKNQVLAQLNTADLEQALKEKEAALASAKASYEFSVHSTDRYKKLLDKHYYSQNDYDIALNQLQVNKANVKQAEAALTEAKLQLQYACIVSTLNGIVSERNIDPGMNVSVGQTLFKVVNLDRLELRAIVPADQISQISLKQTAMFDVDGIAQSFEGQIVRINPSTVEGTRAYYAYINVHNHYNVLKSGMFATGAIILKNQPDSIVIPLQAVHYEKHEGIKEAFVYKINLQKKIQKQIIKIGLKDKASNKVQVVSGLKIGDLVIASEIEIKEGDDVLLPVKPVK